MSAVLATIPDEQHDRQKLLGGSDAAAILGISPWRTPLQVYLDKVEPRSLELDHNKARIFARGKRMEPYVVDLLAAEEGLTIVGRGNRYRDPELPFLAAEIDAETHDGRNVEIKTVSPFKAFEWGEEQTDSIPVHYTAQAMHGLMVTGRAVCIFGVLIGGDDFRVYQVERDEETIAAMRQREIEFWQLVQDRTPPDTRTTADVLAMFARDTGRIVEADADVAAAIARMQGIKEQIKALETEAAPLYTAVHRFMGDAAVLQVDGKAAATWKTQSTRRFNQSAFSAAHPDLFEQFRTTTESRVFRLK